MASYFAQTRDLNAFERVHYHHSPALPGIELLSAEHSARAWYVHHEWYAFCACEAAAARVRYRGEIHDLADRDLMLLEPGETHQNTVVHKPADFKVLLVPVQTLEAASRELGSGGSPHFRQMRVRFVPRLFAALYRLGHAIERGETRLEQQSRFATLVNRLLEHGERKVAPGRGTTSAGAMERVKTYVRERFDQPIELDELARVARMSRFHLARTFARHTGVPPHAYQIQLRVDRARTLLRAGAAPAEAAAITGFADQSHLGRHFKRIWHVTPGQYARDAQPRDEG